MVQRRHVFFAVLFCGSAAYLATNLAVIQAADALEFTAWESSALDRDFPRDAKLNDVQRGFRNWSEQTFPRLMDKSWWEKLNPKEKASAKSQWLKQLASKEENDRIQAIQALAAVGDKKTVPGLLKIAADRTVKDNADRCEAVRALGIIGDQSAIPKLVHLTYHYNSDTRLWAQISLVRLTGENFGHDVAAWKSWCDKQGGKIPISAQKIAWGNTPELIELSNPEKQDENDRHYIRMANDPGKNKSAGNPPASKQADNSDSPDSTVCDPETGVCKLPDLKSPAKAASAGKKNASESDYDKVLPLEFKLFDAYGREVHSADYRGAPVLISTGACWCGGCQGHADDLRLLEEKYRKRGLQVIRSVTYDNELPAWEFQKHYRLPYVQLLDPSREFEIRYNSDGWPFIMLVDAEGNVVFRTNMGNLQDLTGRIESILPQQSPVETVRREGVSYMPETLKRSGETEKLRPSDRFPSLACADDGKMYLAFTTNRAGTQDVYLRVFDGQKWLPDQPIAATDADEFDAAVLVDKQNRPWVSWTSNAAGPQYNIFAVCAAESSPQKTHPQVTRSLPKNGTMHARMALDSNGRIWITYYQWEWIFGRSRDKEVYARYLNGNRWSDEIHISPEDILPADDHTDPVIAPFGNGVVIGWSWDFHHVPENHGYSQVPQEPSIFLRTLEPGPKLNRARPVSGPHVNTRPAIVVGPDGKVVCAWESAVLNRGANKPKIIAASIQDLDQDEHSDVGENVSGMHNNVCTPSLAAGPKGELSLVWAELGPKDQWLLMHSQWDNKKNRWAAPKTILSAGNPRFPSAAYDKDGTLWIAYCADKDDAREVAVLKVK